MSIVTVRSDYACKWLQVKLYALLVGDCQTPGVVTQKTTTKTVRVVGTVRVVNRKETDCHRTKVPELQMQNSVLFCRAEYGKEQ